MDETAIQIEPPKQKRRSFWRTLIVVTIVLGIVVIVIPTIAVCVIPAGRVIGKNACINNLRQIEGAKEQWALETHAIEGTPVVIEAIDKYIPKGHPQCPKGGAYTYGSVGLRPVCSVARHALP